METEELTKLVDGIYKNILEKFNPGARQMINAGKAYLKALHGAAAASRLYVEAMTKLARQAQQGTWGGSSDIGSALMQVVEVYKEIQAQQMNILKAFYVDLLVPLETNLEKDTKVVQSEQKKFLQQHKARTESYTKAVANMKKHRKKGIKSGTKTGSAVDKELKEDSDKDEVKAKARAKNMQILEEEKSKLDVFCEQSLKNAMTQERRRYGFVLERQCSLAKHYLAYHNAGVASYGRRLEEWQEIARTREYLPENVDNMFAVKLRQLSFWQDEDDISSRTILDDDRVSISSQLRKTKSMDASCLDVRSINDVSSLKPLSRAKSEFNLNSSTHSLEQEENSSPRRPKSMAVPDKASWGEASLARAMYAYLSSGDNQLSFLEGDIIVLLGDRKKGWQFGENLRTQCSGWFPLAYTEVIADDSNVNSPSRRKLETLRTNTIETHKTNNTSSSKPPQTTMFGDTLLHRKLKKQNAQKTPLVTSLGPPPSLPAPIPELHQHVPQTLPSVGGHTTQPLLSPQTLRSDASTLPTKRANGYPPPMPSLPLHLANNRVNGAPGSLHSSNDSGFSNDPPPQPEVDYSDDDSSRVQQTAPNEATPNGPPDSKKKELFSSVRGWLLYKSALDLWDDVAEQTASKHSVARTLSARQNDNPGGTLGRFNSHDLLKPSPLAVGKVPEDSSNRITVKRTKSLWKFKRSNKSDILEGMSLWKHRSLIDVRGMEENADQGEKNSNTNEKNESIYASTDRLLKEREQSMEKLNNDKNSVKIENNDQENYYKDDTTGLDDSSESIIVVNDHVNLKKKLRSKYNVSNQSDITQSDTIVQKENKSEMSNSRSDLSEQTETETIGKESYLPRMKLIKSNSNDTWNHYIERDSSGSKEYQTWNPNLKIKEMKKWKEEKRKNNFYKERANNKLKDTPNLFKDQLRLSDIKATCGPWHDLWPVDSGNAFATVKLRKTKTNDRSAPMLS